MATYIKDTLDPKAATEEDYEEAIRKMTKTAISQGLDPEEYIRNAIHSWGTDNSVLNAYNRQGLSRRTFKKANEVRCEQMYQQTTQSCVMRQQMRQRLEEKQQAEKNALRNAKRRAKAKAKRDLRKN